MKFLVLGGTKFLGRHFVEIALAQGHEVTLFNRGKTYPELFPGVEKLRGDRGENLGPLKGRRWDAVVDTSGYVSGDVRSTATLLSDLIENYTFISSLSVYRDFSQTGLDESASVQALPGSVEDASDPETYGARKARCESILEQVMPNRILTVRAGMIVGPYDYVDRFSYWVGRIAKGGEVLAPGRPDHPVQLIDVRDLAEWILRMIEAGRVGNYNATGPDYVLTMEKMIEVCRQVSGSDSLTRWVGEPFLLEQNVTPWSEIPFWIPGDDFAGFFSVDCTKAIRCGLTFRALGHTVSDTLSWLRSRESDDQEPKRAMVLAQGEIGLRPERERELLRRWHEKVGTVRKEV